MKLMQVGYLPTNSFPKYINSDDSTNTMGRGGGGIHNCTEEREVLPE